MQVVQLLLKRVKKKSSGDSGPENHTQMLAVDSQTKCLGEFCFMDNTEIALPDDEKETLEMTRLHAKPAREQIGEP